MKLFTRYNRINLIANVSIFLLAVIAFYFLLQFVVVGQVDDDLRIEQHEIETYAKKYERMPEVISVRDQHIQYSVVKRPGKKTLNTIQSADAGNIDVEPFRELVFFVQANGEWYKISVSKSLEGTDNLIQSIAIITLLTVSMILIVSSIINRLLLKKLWQPFYETLSAMRNFELGKNKVPSFADTNIDEFDLMNETLRQATSKAGDDYQHLKEFTENASHELQTPLAIIQSKLDVLIQDEKLSEPQSRAVQGAYLAIQRLTRLNQALLLLTKIENGQFAETTPINISKKVKEKLEQFEEMIMAKSLHVTTTLDEAANIQMNPVLADVLLNNLLSNAIKYNMPGGAIDIIVDQGVIEISNSAYNSELDKEKLFRRFASAGKAKDGIGLGLAIVQQVADASGLQSIYTYEDNQHHFILLNHPNRE